MFKFGGFKASLNFYNGMKTKKKEDDGVASVGSITGAYRTNRDEFFGNNLEIHRKTAPSVIVPQYIPPEPPFPPEPPLRKVKSTNKIIKDRPLPPNIPIKSDISEDPRGAESSETRRTSQELKIKPKNDEPKKLDAEKRVEKQRQEEQKRLEKQRIAEQKKQEKLALQEQAKEEKLRKEKEKNEARQNKKRNKKAAPQVPLANPLANVQPSDNAPATQPPQYTTNTLDSSISKSSGPPPYDPSNRNPSEIDAGNVTFSKPVDTGTWDMISQHRNQISRAVPSTLHRQKQTTMDLNYRMGEDVQPNSEA